MDSTTLITSLFLSIIHSFSLSLFLSLICVCFFSLPCWLSLSVFVFLYLLSQQSTHKLSASPRPLLFSVSPLLFPPHGGFDGFGVSAELALVGSASGVKCCLQTEKLVSTFGFLDCVSWTWNLFCVRATSKMIKTYIIEGTDTKATPPYSTLYPPMEESITEQTLRSIPILFNCFHIQSVTSSNTFHIPAKLPLARCKMLTGNPYQICMISQDFYHSTTASLFVFGQIWFLLGHQSNQKVVVLLECGRHQNVSATGVW
jgi:hypothetical protein